MPRNILYVGMELRPLYVRLVASQDDLTLSLQDVFARLSFLVNSPKAIKEAAASRHVMHETAVAGCQFVIERCDAIGPVHRPGRWTPLSRSGRPRVLLSQPHWE